MSDNSLIGQTLELQSGTVTLIKQLSQSVEFVYYLGKGSKKTKYLLRYFNELCLVDYEAEKKINEQIPDHPNKLKIISVQVNSNHAYIIYEYAENLTFNNCKEKILNDPEVLIKFIRDLFSIIKELNKTSFIYHEINQANLLFDKNFTLKLAGFCNSTRSEDIRTLENHKFYIISGRQTLKAFETKNNLFLGSCIDMLMIGKFLKSLELHNEPCKKCSKKSKNEKICKTQIFFSYLIQVLTHRNPTLRGIYEEVMEILSAENLCKSKLFNLKSSKLSPSILNELLPKLLLESSKHFNLSLLYSLLFELQKSRSFYKILASFIKKASYSVSLSYRQSLQLLITSFFININLEFSSPEEERTENFLEKIAEKWLDSSLCKLSSRLHSLNVISSFYSVTQFQSFLFPHGNSRGKWKNLSPESASFLKSYLKRINEFLALVFENDECLFDLKDLVLVIVIHEINCMLKLMKYRRGDYLDELMEAQIDESEGYLKKYQIYLKLFFMKNATLQRRPAIFKESVLNELAALNHSQYMASGKVDSLSPNITNYQKKDLEVKELNHLSEVQMKTFYREMSLMMNHFHPQIIPLLGTDDSLENINIVFPHLQGGCLSDLLHKKKKIFINDIQKLSILIDIARALDYLHSKNVIYRALSTSNIYLESEVKNCNDAVFIRLGNFDNARQVDRFMTNLTNNSPWASPEVLKGSNYGCKSDVFSFGITAWEIITRVEPTLKQQEIFELQKKIIAGMRPDINQVGFGRNTQEIRDLIVECWDSDQYYRPSFQDILKRLIMMVSG